MVFKYFNQLSHFDGCFFMDKDYRIYTKTAYIRNLMLGVRSIKDIMPINRMSSPDFVTIIALKYTECNDSFLNS